jgi:hypothetical protein
MPGAAQKRKQCTVYGCKSYPAGGRGWCPRHYQRWKRHGSPTARVVRRPTVWEEPKPTGPAKYGLTPAQYEELWAGQDGRCAVCRSALVKAGMKSCNIDHCHATGRVRGILCRRCNWGMGILGDDPDLLEAGAAYLRNTGGQERS